MPADGKNELAGHYARIVVGYRLSSHAITKPMSGAKIILAVCSFRRMSIEPPGTLWYTEVPALHKARQCAAAEGKSTGARHSRC